MSSLLPLMLWYIYVPGRKIKYDILISENKGTQNQNKMKRGKSNESQF
jgi:hypothetical protein